LVSPHLAHDAQREGSGGGFSSGSLCTHVEVDAPTMVNPLRK
jgi:hypothetical protein